MILSVRVTSLAVACLLFAATGAKVRAEEKIVWLTGSKLSKALKSQVSFRWNERPLRDGLQQLSRSTSVAILLDRRIDPLRPIDLEVTNVPLVDALKAVAEEFQGSVALVGSVVYLGPRGNASRVQALTALRDRESPKGWLAKIDASWPELAEPRELVADIVESAGAAVSNPELIPHDVWPAWEGPALSSAQRLSLVLAGFDLTFKVHDQKVTILPAPDTLTYDQTYSTRSGASGVVSELKLQLPAANVMADGASRIRVTGTAEEHTKVAEYLAGQKTNTKTVISKGEKRYTLSVQNQPVGAIVRTIAKELGVEVKAQQSLVEKLTPKTSVDVKQVTAGELLKQVLDPAGIKFKLTEKSLELSE